MNNFSENYTWQPPPPTWVIKTVHYLLASRKHDLQVTIERPALFILKKRVKGFCDDNLQVHKREGNMVLSVCFAYKTVSKRIRHKAKISKHRDKTAHCFVNLRSLHHR